MNETSKTKNIWNGFENGIVSGKGIDIGCGPDPVREDVYRFDVEQGDANCISQYVKEDFDYVFSSHCLEHMFDPHNALLEWWKLVRPGGYLVFIVPDEDLYEQGFFPSRFNPDHKATFTISKQQSWSPVSINVLDLVKILPNSELISLKLQDNGYNRSLAKHGMPHTFPFLRFVIRAYDKFKALSAMSCKTMDCLKSYISIEDQTLKADVVAQIQCIVKKMA